MQVSSFQEKLPTQFFQGIHFLLDKGQIWQTNIVKARTHHEFLIKKTFPTYSSRATSNGLSGLFLDPDQLCNSVFMVLIKTATKKSEGWTWCTLLQFKEVGRTQYLGSHATNSLFLCLGNTSQIRTRALKNCCSTLTSVPCHWSASHNMSSHIIFINKTAE